MNDDIKLKGFTQPEDFHLLFHLQSILKRYRTDPGDVGNWYGRGPGRNSFVGYSVSGRWLHVYRTKTAIVVVLQVSQ